jgi:predicted phage baseplate assembly protein
MAADSTIRLAPGSSNQEDCKIISVDSQKKTLTLETALKYNHPKESSIGLPKLPTINRITVSAEINKNDLTPDFCFFNTVPIDLSKDFYPFGEQPRFNDTLYIASKEAFARSNANVTLTVTLSEGLFVNTDGSVEIAWEVWNGQNWQKLETKSTTLSGEPITSSKNLPANFTGNGKVELTLSQTNFQTTVNGETNYWLRARIVKGNFGAHLSQATTIAVFTEDSKTKKELTVNSVRGFMPNDRVQIISGGQNPEICEIESSDNKTNKLTLKTELRQTYLRGTSVMLLSDSVLGPPSVKSLTLSYSYEASRSLSACCAYNDFHYVEPLTTELREVVLQPFQPFKATADRERTLYLGFDKPFANRPTTLFTQVEPPQPKEVASQVQTIDTKPVQLVWEYASPSGWSRLGVKDETSAFAERGLIQFIGPRDMIKTSEFGQELYWLRVRWQEGQFRVPPRLRRLLTNTMWATQATTLKEEILGSSDGNPKQIFDTVQKPVLKGEQLEVQEAKIPSPEEHEVIRSLEGDDAVNIVRDETGQIEAVWVRWHNVRDFYGSGPRDRHYVLDRLMGEVQFGDGQYGMVPPQGRNNIRLSQYQTGGGTQGNLAANTVVQLKTTVPYVEKVTNLEAAGGGAEQESLEQVKQRGPKFLRHRGRAVTWQDFEDLAYEASPDVARAKAIAPSFDPLHNLWIKDPKAPNLDQHKTPHDAGQIRMLIVPRSLARQPVPSLALIDRVTAYVRERCDPSVNLQVTGPEWQAVSVTAEVVPVSLERADAVRAAVVQHLENFLHPLSGGKKSQGWALGRLPQQSDLYAVIESIPGVDHVQSLKIQPDREELSPEKLVYSGIHTVTSILPEEGA